MFQYVSTKLSNLELLFKDKIFVFPKYARFAHIINYNHLYVYIICVNYNHNLIL